MKDIGEYISEKTSTRVTHQACDPLHAMTRSNSLANIYPAI